MAIQSGARYNRAMGRVKANNMLPVAIYARVSTQDQDCAMQLTELRGYVERMGWPPAVEYIEKASGKAGAKRPLLDKLMADARMKRVSTVIVWKLDRFGRSLKELVERVMELDQAGVRFVAPQQGIDTDQRSSVGRLLLHIMAAFAEFERDLIRERTKAGVDEARRAGKHCGRPKAVFDRRRVLDLHQQGLSVRQIARKTGVGRSTILRAVQGGR